METSRQDAAQERSRATLAMMPETFVRNWQMTGLRVLRAQERMLHGMMSAARLEMQFGQDLLMNRMARFTPRSENGARTDGAFQEFDRMIAMMREVTEELRSGFSEATQLLTETADEAFRDTTKKAGQAAQALTDRGAEAVHESLQASGKFTKKMAESGAEATREAGNAAKENIKDVKENTKDAKENVKESARDAKESSRENTRESANAEKEGSRRSM
jgi:gas vesicle protein